MGTALSGFWSPMVQRNSTPQQDLSRLEVGEETLEIHGPLNRNHANDPSTLEGVDQHAKRTGRSEQHGSLAALKFPNM